VVVIVVIVVVVVVVVLTVVVKQTGSRHCPLTNKLENIDPKQDWYAHLTPIREDPCPNLTHGSASPHEFTTQTAS